MKIIKRGNYLRAICTEKHENGTIAEIGSQLGYINIKNKSFFGATACMIELYKALEELNPEVPEIQIKSLHELEVFENDSDQPATCPDCGARTDFIEIDAETQQHRCLDCKKEFFLTFEN